MNTQGPQIELLTRRIAEIPPEFLAWKKKGKPLPQVDAVLFDLAATLAGPGATPPDPRRLFDFMHRAAINHQRLALVGAWLLHERWFSKQRRFAGAALEWLCNGLRELAEIVDAAAAVSDGERREELARACLAALGLTPAGESAEFAADRLTTLSSVERKRLVQAAREAEKRAREVREALARQAAAEAAAKTSRE